MSERKRLVGLFDLRQILEHRERVTHDLANLGVDDVGAVVDQLHDRDLVDAANHAAWIHDRDLRDLKFAHELHGAFD